MIVTETPTRELALRRRAAIAAGHLRRWVHDARDRRPSRKELKSWVRLVLDERHALFRRATAAERDFAHARERGDALEARLRAVLAQPVERDRRVHTAECVCGVRVTVRMKSEDGAG